MNLQKFYLFHLFSFSFFVTLREVFHFYGYQGVFMSTPNVPGRVVQFLRQVSPHLSNIVRESVKE